MKVISVINLKGGVGKTTSAVNLAAAVGLKGFKTLLVDIDPQGNTTSGLGVNKKNVAISTYDLIVGGADAESAIIKTAFENLDLFFENYIAIGGNCEQDLKLDFPEIPCNTYIYGIAEDKIIGYNFKENKIIMI